MKDFTKYRILIVDDQVEYARITGGAIQRMGHSCEIAANALEAMEKLGSEHFDLVISDIVMAGKDGIELTKECLAKYPHLNFIIMTGHAQDYSYTDIIDAGASDFIEKPFASGELQAKINRISREKRIVQCLKETKEQLQGALVQLRSTLEQTIQVLTSAFERMDTVTVRHQIRVAAMAYAIAREIGLSEQAAKGVKLAGLIHDTGKICVPNEILSKPSKLGEAEKILIRQHPHEGFEILNAQRRPPNDQFRLSFIPISRARGT